MAALRYTSPFRRGGREVEGAPLLREYTGQNLYRGFESLSLRHVLEWYK